MDEHCGVVLGPRGWVVYRIDPVTRQKRCRQCLLIKAVDDFPQSARYFEGVNARCFDCLRRYHRERMAAKPKRDKLRQYLKKYGLTLEGFDALFEAQNGTCAICRKPESRKTKSGTVFQLVVDHDHATGLVRGLLCHECNTGLGKFKDDEALLGLAIAYLKKGTD